MIAEGVLSRIASEKKGTLCRVLTCSSQSVEWGLQGEGRRISDREQSMSC